MPSLDPRKWFRGSKTDPEFNKALLITAAQAHTKRGISQHEIEQRLGIDSELIHDNWEEQELENATKIKRPMKDDKGNLVWVEVGTNYDWRTLRTLSSHLIRVGVIDEKSAKLYKLYAERALIGVEMNMDEAEFDMGMANYFDAKRVQIFQAIDESIAGRKGQLLKISRQATEFLVSSEEERRKRGIL